MIMLVLLTLATVALASVTAYFTVFGLAALAPQVSWAMIALGLALELSQYAAVTFMYSNWKTLPRLLKLTMSGVLVSVLTLNAIGVFGYLQSAFAPALSQTQQADARLSELSTRRQQLERELQDIDAETKRVPDTLVRARINLLREYDARRTQVASDLRAVREEQQALTATVAVTKAHTGPLAYVASALNVPLETAVTWMSMLLTVTLEPMALLMSVGLVFMRRQRGQEKKQNLSDIRTLLEPHVVPTAASVAPSPSPVPAAPVAPEAPAAPVASAPPATPAVPEDDTAVEVLPMPPTTSAVAPPRLSVLGTRLPPRETS